MIAGPWVESLVRKEVRALMPTWLGCALLISMVGVTHDRGLVIPVLLVYGVGAIALGALSIGHEYTHKTMGVLLAQPVDRRQILVVKAAVLAAALAVLTALLWLTIPEDPHILRSSPLLPYVLLAGLLSFLVAPWLTMMCRGPLAGAVFSVAVPAILLLLGEVGGSFWFGATRPGDVDRFRNVVFWWGIVDTSLACCVLAWRTVARLEDIDGGGAVIGTPAWLQLASVDRPARRHHPLWALVKKELRLQQLTFIVVGIYVIGFVVILLLSRYGQALREDTLFGLTMLYVALVAILIGALASAEERQLGTVEWQMLLPMPQWQQWAVKSGVAVALSMTLWLGAFIVLARLQPGDHRFALNSSGFWLQITTFVLLLTPGSLYVSSLSTSGVKALAMALPVGIVLSLFGATAMSLIRWSVFNVMRARGDLSRVSIESHEAVVNAATFGVGVIFGLVLLRFAFVNHRSPDRPLKRVAVQVTALAGFAIVCLATMVAVTTYPASPAR